MYPVGDWVAEKSSPHQEKVIIPSKSDSDLSLLHQSYAIAKGHTYQLSSLSDYSLLEEVLFSYQLAIPKELCVSVLVSQFYLNNMKCHQGTYNFPSRKKCNIKTLLLLLFLEFIFIQHFTVSSGFVAITTRKQTKKFSLFQIKTKCSMLELELFFKVQNCNFYLKILSILMPINILELRFFFSITICLIFKVRDCDFGLITIFTHRLCCWSFLSLERSLF